MLFGRPGGAGKYETINDLDGHIVNTWRSIRMDPMEVARYADYPISEIDVHARHRYLVDAVPELLEKLKANPDYFNPKLAGWWVWGKSCWIGDGWCQHPEWKARPDITTNNGVHALKQQLPNIGGGSKGVHALAKKLPELHGNKGINTMSALPIVDRMRLLAERLRHVRICCGDWKRIISPSTMGTNEVGHSQGIAPCGVFLDPVYPGYEKIYGGGESVVGEVRAFCEEYGRHPLVRIALCGYEGDYDLPGWDVVAWKAHGGYANQSKKTDNENARRERIWFSPSCLRPERQRSLDDILRERAAV
jgi:hypothetical protein